MEELRQLKIGEIADTQSFCFMWVGETHLEQGRELLKRWGFRRVEDICWVKTNRKAPMDAQGRVRQATVMYGDTSILQRTKEQCIVGVKGTLKRSVDTHFIHANCDVDLIMEEEKEFGSTQKPTELYETIEHFCLGRRRLELFGLDRNLRDGWLTLGRGLTTHNWNKSAYLSWFEGNGHWPEIKDYRGGRLLGSIPEIDQLRPKSPVRNARAASPVRRGKEEDDDKPLPEDLGEMAPDITKATDI
jgi:mRNA (2'-O-methyladenosine-N6-)-methyltransferase